MNTTLFPSPLVMCNWASFKGEKSKFNFRITYAMKSKFIKRFGDRFMTMAINSMMNYYVNNPEQFKIDSEKFYDISMEPKNVIEEIAQKTFLECVPPGKYDDGNSKQIIINTGFELYCNFMIKVLAPAGYEIVGSNWCYRYGSGWLYQFEKNYVFNFLLFMALDRLKIVEVSGNPL